MKPGYNKPELMIMESLPADVLNASLGGWDESVSGTGSNWDGDFTEDTQYGL